MPDIKPSQWVALSLLAIVSVFIWLTLSLPRYQIIDLSFDRNRVGDIAKTYLTQKMGINLQGYKQATVFSMDSGADRYLQKTLGFKASREFIKKFDYDLFYWVVRFFKEKQKEEFSVVISAKTGKIIGFTHSIEDTAARPFVGQDEARGYAIDFLVHRCAFSPGQYSLHSQNTEKRENRVDYSFSWEEKNMGIPWDNRYGGGKAKLLMTVGVSGKDILYFNKNQLNIPEGFNRHIDSLKQTGQNLTLIFRVLYLALLTIAIMLLVNRKKYVVTRIVRPFYIGAAIALFVCIVLDVLNGYQNFIFDYPTTQSFNEYLLRGLIGVCIDAFFIVITFLLPALSAEALRYEARPQEKQGGFLTLILSSFFSVPVAQRIWAGYLIAAIALALQACIFQIGYTYFGVWNELSWMVQSSTAMVPALTAFVVGFHASFSEEIMFRSFAINLFRRYGLNSFLTVFLSALIWGFGHTGYAVFPMWFRGLEVTCLGIIFGYAYLRLGLVTVIVAHFLMDAFWGSLQYFMAPKISFDFLSCLLVLGVPLVFSLFAFVLNRSTWERPWRLSFSPQQEFNYRLLQQICSLKTPQQLAVFKEELLHHGWDPAIIERVYKDK